MKNSLFSPSLWLLWIHYVSWNEGFYFLASWPWSSRETIYCFCISEWICSLWQMKGSLCVKIKWTFYPPAREEHFQRQPMRWNLITICFSDKKKQGLASHCANMLWNQMTFYYHLSEPTWQLRKCGSSGLNTSGQTELLICAYKMLESSHCPLLHLLVECNQELA